MSREMFWLYLVLVLVAEALVLVALGAAAPDVVALSVVPLVPLTLVAAFVVYPKLDGISRRARQLSPQEITGHRLEVPRASSPQELSRSIVERAAEIRRALRESPSQIQIEMCAIGYRTCANDMITLTHLINEKIPGSGSLRRLRLRRLLKRATGALSAARKALPPGALRATRQEKQ